MLNFNINIVKIISPGCNVILTIKKIDPHPQGLLPDVKLASAYLTANISAGFDVKKARTTEDEVGKSIQIY